MLQELIKKERIFFLDTRNREETLKELAHRSFTSLHLLDAEAFYQAVIQREKLSSTALGMGVAIPHAKMESLPHFFIALAILQQPIAWNAIDGSLVQLIFLIGGKEEPQADYLRLLSALTQVIKDEEIRKKLLFLRDPAAIVELFHAI